MEFLKGAKDFTRNPLGIIALFISLIYGFASFLLGNAAEKLEPIERWPLIAFIVIFPFVVLFVFYRLVTKHHFKLYSPSDFKADDSFLKAMTSKEKEAKIESDIIEVLGEPLDSNIENKSKAKINIRSKLLESESYVVDYFEKELKIKPELDVKISPEKYLFDAYYGVPKEKITLLDVKYYNRPTITFSVINEFIYRAQLTHEYMSVETKFIIAIVLDGDSKFFNKIEETWDNAIASTDLDIQLKVFKASEIFT